jgi:hypothetical protein
MRLNKTVIVFFITLMFVAGILIPSIYAVQNNAEEFQETNAQQNVSTPNNNLIRALDSYRNNLTPVQKRIPEEILQITDPNFPQTGMTPDTVRRIMINSNQLRGDDVNLYIYLMPSASLHSLDSIASSITSRNEDFHVIVAWINLQNVSTLASMDDVEKIRLVVPPEHAAGNISLVPSQTKTPVGSLSPLALYRQNLIYPKNRIPENILQIIDPDFPELGISREQIRSDRIASNLLITSENAKKQFNTTIINGQPIGDQIFLTIYINPNASTHVLDPLVTEVRNRDEEFHIIDSWVDFNNVEKIAALDQVRGMQLADAIGHSNVNINETPSSTQLPVATHTTPISIFIINGSLICAGLVSIFLRIKRRK